MTHRVVITGGTGLVGRFITEHFLARGDDVVVAGRTPPRPDFFTGPVEFREMPLDPQFDYRPLCTDADIIVHGAFSHVPGRYRGGEGDDPERFVQLNVKGTARLFQDAKAARVKRCIFLSSRAVYGSPTAGTTLYEDMAESADTLYGRVKLEGEQVLARLADEHFGGASLRITGVYGPAGQGVDHKWVQLFRQYEAGEAIPPRAATEVHGIDVAQAVEILATVSLDDVNGRTFNVSDVMKDTAQILAPVASRLGTPHPLPSPGDPSTVSAMVTERLRALGWSPGGDALFDETLAALADDYVAR